LDCYDFFQKKKVPSHLEILETRLVSNGSGWLAASGITYADLYLFTLLGNLGEKRELALANFPHVRKLEEAVKSHPLIAEWLNKRPITVM
jgi:glutathione S-transferase